jgi:tetratricopeptide (TPR) repeat protein
MKAQHRHELQTNQLAQWLDNTIEQLRPYARAIVGVLVAVAIVVGVYAYLGAVQRRTETAAADQFIAALQISDPRQSQRELQNTMEEYRGTAPATIAQLVLAERSLDDGSNALFTNKQAGRESLFKAAEAFMGVEKETHDPMLKMWALYGLGRSHESMGDLDQAKDDYQRLLKEYPDSSLSDAARTHINRLDQPATKEFYAWFKNQDPKPPAPENLPGVPGLKPSFNLDEPSGAPQGDVKLPSALPSSGAKAPTSNGPSSAAPSSAAPAGASK